MYPVGKNGALFHVGRFRFVRGCIAMWWLHAPSYITEEEMVTLGLLLVSGWPIFV